MYTHDFAIGLVFVVRRVKIPRRVPISINRFPCLLRTVIELICQFFMQSWIVHILLIEVLPIELQPWRVVVNDKSEVLILYTLTPPKQPAKVKRC